MDAANALDEEPEAATAGEKPEEQRTMKDSQDPKMEFLAALDKKIDRVLAVLDEAEEGETADPMDEAIKKLEGEKKPASEAEVVEAGTKDENAKENADQDTATRILKAVRPAVAAITDDAQRRAVSDAIIKSVMENAEDSDLKKIAKITQSNAVHRSMDSGKGGCDVDVVQAAYDNMNPHIAKEVGKN